MSEKQPVSAENIMDVGILAPNEITFFRNERGFLGAKTKERECRRVKLVRILPFAAPGEYISVEDMDNKELGILRAVSALSDDQRALVEAELDQRYYCPRVEGIGSIKEKMGYFYFEAKIAGTEKVFAVKDITRSIKQLDEHTIIITDVDGNRFLIPDIEKIDGSSRRKIEPYLY